MMGRGHRLEQSERQLWAAENREEIPSINAFLERFGLLANKLRHRAEGHESISSERRPDQRSL
jgi:hypothetical protein